MHLEILYLLPNEHFYFYLFAYYHYECISIASDMAKTRPDLQNAIAEEENAPYAKLNTACKIHDCFLSFGI